MPEARAFPMCCTARILCNFGGTNLTSGDKQRLSKTALKRHVAQEVAAAKGYRCLVVMTNNEQTVANKVLRELDFKHSRWMSKDQHPETKMRLWWKEP